MTHAVDASVHAEIAALAYPSGLHGTAMPIGFSSDDRTVPPHHHDPSIGDEVEHQDMRGDELIMLVDDEPMILTVTKTILETYGYTVLTAQSPKEAMQVAQDLAGAIDILVTDIIMPDMDGRKLAAHLLDSFPRIKCLYMSGYSDDIITDLSELEAEAHFIQKPFSTASLTAKVREVLDQ